MAQPNPQDTQSDSIFSKVDLELADNETNEKVHKLVRRYSQDAIPPFNSNDDVNDQSHNNNEEKIVSLDEDDANENEEKYYSNMSNVVVEQIKSSGFAKLAHSMIAKRCGLMVVGYLREHYDIDDDKILPATVISIFQDYFPNANLFCQNQNYISLRSGSGGGDDDNSSSENDEYDIYVILKKYCVLSSFISTQLETDSTQIVGIKQVPSDTLKVILEYLVHHKGIQPDALPCPVRSIHMSQICNDQWDAKWIDTKNKKETFEIILGANYLGVNALVHLGAAKIATLIKQLDQNEINRIIEDEERYRREQAAIEAKNNENQSDNDDDDDDSDNDDGVGGNNDNNDNENGNSDGGGLDDDDN